MAHGMVDAAAEKSMEDLVLKMFRIQDVIWEAQSSQKKLSSKEEKEQKSVLNMAQGKMMDIIMNLTNEPHDFLQFAFFLRKFDKSEKYSEEFLRGKVMPSILVDIILSNKWNDAISAMLP